MMTDIYRQIYNISRNLVGNKPVNHSDVVGASPAILGLTTGFNGLGKKTAVRDENI